MLVAKLKHNVKPVSLNFISEQCRAACFSLEILFHILRCPGSYYIVVEMGNHANM